MRVQSMLARWDFDFTGPAAKAGQMRNPDQARIER